MWSLRPGASLGPNPRKQYLTKQLHNRVTPELIYIPWCVVHVCWKQPRRGQCSERPCCPQRRGSAKRSEPTGRMCVFLWLCSLPLPEQVAGKALCKICFDPFARTIRHDHMVWFACVARRLPATARMSPSTYPKRVAETLRAANSARHGSNQSLGKTRKSSIKHSCRKRDWPPQECGLAHRGCT